MASLKDLKDRISSVKATQKITKAMQMVAAAKLRRAQQVVEQSRAYSQALAGMVANLSLDLSNEELPALLTLKQDSEYHSYLLVVCTADRGLCGGFNSHIVRKAKERIKELQQLGKEIKIITVGKKGYDQLCREYKDIIIDRMELRETGKTSLDFANQLYSKIIGLLDDNQFDRCEMVYSQFKSVLHQVPITYQLIPADIDSIAKKSVVSEAGSNSGEKGDLAGIFEYEPNIESILQDLAKKNILSQIYIAILENNAGEMGAKMTAMDNATRNAGDMIDRLSITYNRQRQAKITTELIEIISGAEAL